MNDDRTVEQRYRQESDNLLKCLSDPEQRRLAESWFQADTVDAWRHQRMYDSVDPILKLYPNSDWLTVGDGRFGSDAHYILSKGHSVLASDISDTLLRVAAEKGYIRDFQVANAESLPFESGSFDFVFCKESYHHFPRPMLALYEMLRVARKGVVLIEPNEAASLASARFLLKHLFNHTVVRFGLSSILRTRDTSIIHGYANSWEEVGNYIYSISQREIEKVALGMGYAACAFKGLNDHYEKGVEFEPATENSLLFQKVKEQIARADRLCRKTLNNDAYRLLVAVIFKQSLESDAVQVLERTGFVVRQLPRNPHTTQGDSHQ